MENPRANILIVDDNPKNIQVLGGILAKEGYKVHFALNGLDALKKIQANKPELILLDVIMPELDGYETCAHLKASQATKDIPIIFLTARTETKDVVKGFQLGAVDYVTKPFQKEEILVRIQTHLQVQQMKRKVEAQNILLRQEIHERDEALKQARQTQLALLPQIEADETNYPGLQIATKYIPMEEIGGDFYDIVDLGEGKIGILLADVTGHGIPAALLSFMISGLFKSISRKNEATARTMHRLNKMFYDQKPFDKFATALYCIYSRDTHSLTYTSAGHPFGYIIRKDPVELICLNEAQGTLLGFYPGEKDIFQQKTLPVLPGDKVFLYTDGITDIADHQKKMFETQKLEELLLNNSSLPIHELIEEVYAHVLAYSGKEKFEDDITIVGFECERKDF